MSEKINFNTKGETNVEGGETALRKTNIIDMEAAEIKHAGKGDWDDFEAFEASNEKEGEYVAPPENDVDLDEVLRVAKASHVGRKILSLKSLRMAA